MRALVHLTKRCIFEVLTFSPQEFYRRARNVKE